MHVITNAPRANLPKKKKKVYITGAYFCCKAFREAMVQEQEKDKLKSEASL